MILHLLQGGGGGGARGESPLKDSMAIFRKIFQIMFAFYF